MRVSHRLPHRTSWQDAPRWSCPLQREFMSQTRIGRLLPALLCACLLSGGPAHALDTRRTDVHAFIAEMVERHELDAGKLNALFRKVETRKSILDAISRPAERVIPWHEYRDRFLTERRILKGADFWQAHAVKLANTSRDGVPAGVVVGILGVETMYGEITGHYRVIDALSTLAFDYPPRSSFFRRELEQFLLLTQEEHVQPLTALGSYAGAMGAPQFMPTSYRTFAVDGDGDGRRNLWDSWDDVIASVANYLARHGWRTGEPIVVAASLADPDLTRFDTSVIELNETVDSLRAKGVSFDVDLPGTAPAMLVVAEGDDAPEYRVGFTNFYAITRYNRSVMYAMAVHDLGQVVANLVAEQDEPR
jgi:peptidoglycan lytic transglycosylase B